MKDEGPRIFVLYKEKKKKKGEYLRARRFAFGLMPRLDQQPLFTGGAGLLTPYSSLNTYTHHHSISLS